MAAVCHSHGRTIFELDVMGLSEMQATIGSDDSSRRAPISCEASSTLSWMDRLHAFLALL